MAIIKSSKGVQMKLKNFLIILSIIFFSSQARTETCTEIKDCIELVSKLTGDKYLLDKDIKGKLNHTKNFSIKKENADQFISHALHISGFTRLPFDKDTWTVLPQRDVRYQALKNYIHGEDKIPNNDDFINVVIKLKNRFLAGDISRSFRPFMSRYGRIVDLKDPGLLVISDTAKNSNRLIEMVALIDREPTEQDEKKAKDKERFNQQIRELEAKTCNKEK